MSNTLPTAIPVTQEQTLPQQKATKLNQLVNVSRKDAVAGDSLVYTDAGVWEPQNVTPGPGDLTEPMFADGAVSTRALADNSVTDPKIGDRTVDDSAVTPPSSDTGSLTVLLNRIVRMIKAITGKSGWKIFPSISLEALNIHHARHSTGGADEITPASISAATSTHGHTLATTSVAGYMSSTDKTKLDGVETGSTNTPLASTSPASESVASTGTAGTSTTVARSDHRHAMPNNATTGSDGFMSSGDKAKLNSVATSAAAVTTGTVPITPTSNLGAVGTGTDAAREDHRHAMPSGANMLSNLLTVDGSGSLLDADKVDGLHASDLTSLVGTETLERQASAARTLSTTPTVMTGTSAGSPRDGTYFFVIQADFLCLDAADIGVAFTAQLYVNGGGTGIMANFTAGAINARATVSASGFYFMTTGATYELRVSKSSGSTTASKAEVSTSKITGFIIST